MTNQEAICDLVEGLILKWQGLQPFPSNELPLCLGQMESNGWLKFNQGYIAYRAFRPGTGNGSVAWLFTFDDNLVHLIEVFFQSSSVKVEQLLEQLDAPELQLEYPLAAQLQRPLQMSDEELKEFVFARRGLALLVGYAPNSHVRLVRVRGFEVMPAQRYKELFVDLPEVRFLE